MQLINQLSQHVSIDIVIVCVVGGCVSSHMEGLIKGAEYSWG